MKIRQDLREYIRENKSSIRNTDIDFTVIDEEYSLVSRIEGAGNFHDNEAWVVRNSRGVHLLSPSFFTLDNS
jgi:hypothetical protein